MDNEQPRQELVKCVVVGDTAVGKTQLIRARACNTHVSLKQIVTTHIPTIWAIDQYRIHKEVLQRSWEVVDSVNVSLRLWDTFGDHEKARQFAYGRSDVVLLCFSISSHTSLRNCKTKWYPEIRQYCPNTPVVLVGCKNDLRYMYRDETFLKLCRENNPFFRPLRESDIVSPEQAYAVAKELGVPYYETSVLAHYGVSEVFENVIRAALISRRHRRFWATNLKNVQHPKLQVPYCPPRPQMPEITVLSSHYVEDMNSLLTNQAYTDVKLVAGNMVFPVHKVVLAAACKYFKKLFVTSQSTNEQEKIITALEWMSPASMRNLLSFLYTGMLDFNNIANWIEMQEAAVLLEIPELQSAIENMDIEGKKITFNEAQQQHAKTIQMQIKELCLDEGLFSDVLFQLDDGNVPAHRAFLMARCDVMDAMFRGDFRESSASVVRFPGMTKKCFQQLLFYLYTDCIDDSLTVNSCLELLQLANRLCLPHLVTLVEKFVIQELLRINSSGVEISEHVIWLLEPCQIHNADQLADWCLHHIVVNYNGIAIKYPKLLRNLVPENQAYLNTNKWPPTWYTKACDLYERCVRERELRETPSRFFTFGEKNKNGCFCFRGKQSGNQLSVH